MNDQAITRDSHYGAGDEATYAGITSFMRRRYTRDLAGVDVAVLGVPYDLATSNRSGARLGPRAVRAISANLAWEESVVGWDFNPFDELAVVDYGDCPFDPGEPHKVPEEIYQYAAGILEQDVALLTLGGDHFISYPLLKAHYDKHGPWH
nr:arginase family protein [Halioglobus japonicus]